MQQLIGVSGQQSARLLAWAVGGFVVGLSFTLVHSRYEAAAAGRRALPLEFTLNTSQTAHIVPFNSGIVIKFIRRERAADFEDAVGRLKQAFDRPDQAQPTGRAGGWKVFKAAETASNGDVVYVFEIDRALKGQDLALATILDESLLSEAQPLYRRDANAGANELSLNLFLLADFAEHK